MNVAIDVSPLKTGHFLQHRVRGTGFYIEHLRKSLIKGFKNDTFFFFTKGEPIPNEADVVHHPYFEPFFLTLPLIKKHKTVVTVHDLTPLVFAKEFPSGIKGMIKWQLQKKILQNTDAVITDSDCSKRDIEKFVGISPDKIHRIYLAADSHFKPLKNNQYEGIFEKFSLPKKFVLYVGDATWNKNLPKLLEAIKIVKVPLVMVGKTLMEEKIDINNPWNKDLVEVQKIASENKDIRRLGFVEANDLVALYNAATLLVMPSIYEGFGLPVLEAMQSGCPVVTTKGGSLSEIAGESALYVNAGDINDIATGISRVFQDKELQVDLRKRGLQQAKKFSWEKTAKETMEVYEALY